jgi:GNAT superfamily N-acetyltransferase
MPSSLVPFAHHTHGTQQAEQRWTLPDGTPVRLRALRASDVTPLGVLFGTLDATARRRRFHGAVNVTSPAFLSRMAQQNTAHGWAVVVELDRADGGCLLVAEAQLSWRAGAAVADFGMSVATPWQRKGVGRRTLRTLMDEAARRGLQSLRGHVVADNAPMQAMLAGLDFRADVDDDGPCFQATLDLPRHRAKPLPELRWMEALGLLSGLRRLWAPSAAA